MMYSKVNQEIRDRAYRCYLKASQLVQDNPKNYDKELVFKLMIEEQEILKTIKTK